MPRKCDVSPIIEEIEENLKKLNLAIDKKKSIDVKKIEAEILRPLKAAFEQSDNKPKLYKQLSRELHSDKLRLCQDGVAQCLRTLKLSSTDMGDMLSIPQRILNDLKDAATNPNTQDDMPAPVYTAPYCPSDFQDVQEKLYLLFFVMMIVLEATDISQTTGLDLLMSIILSMYYLDPQKRKELCDIGMGAINSITTSINSATTYCNNFFAPKSNEKDNDPDRFIVIEEEGYSVVYSSPPGNQN